MVYKKLWNIFINICILCGLQDLSLQRKNEIVNEQSMIDEQYERELLLNNKFEDSESSFKE